MISAMFVFLLALLVLTAKVFTVSAKDCQILGIEAGPCGEIVHKHDCIKVDGCGWSHHRYCYKKCSDCNKPDISGLVSFYPLDTNTKDCAQNVDGSLVGGATYVANHLNHPLKAISLNGIDGYVDIHEAGNPGVPLKLQIQGELSIVAWVSLRDVHAWWNVIAGCSCHTTMTGYTLFFYSGNFGAQIFNGNSILDFGVQYDPVPNQWIHLALTVKPGQHEIYANGIPRAKRWSNGQFNGNIGYADAPGCSQFSLGHSFLFNTYAAMSLDNVMIIQRALTAAEVQAVFGQTVDQKEVDMAGQKYAIQQRECEISPCEQQPPQQ